MAEQQLHSRARSSLICQGFLWTVTLLKAWARGCNIIPYKKAPLFQTNSPSPFFTFLAGQNKASLRSMLSFPLNEIVISMLIKWFELLKIRTARGRWCCVDNGEPLREIIWWKKTRSSSKFLLVTLFCFYYFNYFFIKTYICLENMPKLVFTLYRLRNRHLALHYFVRRWRSNVKNTFARYRDLWMTVLRDLQLIFGHSYAR